MITEKFSRKEIKQLKKQLEPYGAIKDCCEKTGVHRSTISRVLKTGEATEQVARKLKIYMQRFISRLFIEGLERAA